MLLNEDFEENFNSNIERFTKHLNKVHNSKLRVIDTQSVIDFANQKPTQSELNKMTAFNLMEAMKNDKRNYESYKKALLKLYPDAKGFAGGGSVKDELYVSEYGGSWTIKDKLNPKGNYTLSSKKERAEQNMQFLIDNPSRLAYYRKNEYAQGGGVHTMPDGRVMLNSAHYAEGGRVKYYLNGFEESLNYIMDSTNAKVVSREGSKENGDLIVYFETTDEEYEYAGGGGVESEWVVKMQNEDSGDIETINVLAKTEDEAVENALNESGLSSDYTLYSVNKKYANGGGISGLNDLIRG